MSLTSLNDMACCETSAVQMSDAMTDEDLIAVPGPLNCGVVEDLSSNEYGTVSTTIPDSDNFQVWSVPSFHIL